MDQEFGAFQSQEIKPSKFSKKKILIPLIIIGIVLIGFTAVLAARIWDPLWNPFRPSPEAVLMKSINIDKQVSTFKMQTNFVADLRAIQPTSDSSLNRIKLEFASNDAYDRSQPNTPKHKGDHSLTVYFDSVGLPLQFKTVDIADTTYIQALQLPFLGLFQFLQKLPEDTMSQKEEQWFNIFSSLLAQISDKILNRWIRIDLEEISQQLGIKLDLPTAEDQQKMIDKIYELLAKYPVLKPQKEYPDKVINGEKFYHYYLVLDKENLKSFIKEFQEFLESEGSFPLKEEAAENVKLEEELEKLDSALTRLGEIGTEIFINKKTYHIYQIKGQKEWQTDKGSAKIKWNIVFSDYNQPVEISAPAESISIIELLQEILGPFFQMFLSSQNPPIALPLE